MHTVHEGLLVLLQPVLRELGCAFVYQETSTYTFKQFELIDYRKIAYPPMFSLITEEWKPRPAQPLVCRTSRVDCNRLDRHPARPQNTECSHHRRCLHCPTAIPIVH